MPTILPFRPREPRSAVQPVTVPMVVPPLPEGMLVQEIDQETGRQRQYRVGSLDDPNVQAQARAGNPMRVLKRAVCRCGHRWQAPTIGLCPTCGLADADIVEELVCMAQRV